MREQMLLGNTEDGCLVFANVDIRECAGGDDTRKFLSISFDVVAPFIATWDYLRERADSHLSDADYPYVWELVCEYDCPPSELTDAYLDAMFREHGVGGIVDTSLYPQAFKIDGIEDEVYFEAISCGQGDHRKGLKPIASLFSNWIFILWDNFHLKSIPDDLATAIEYEVDRYMKSFNERQWIKEWLYDVML